MHAFERDVRIDVAAPENTGRVIQRSRVVARRSRRTDESAAEADDGRVAARVAGRELESQARALGETENDDSLRTESRASPRC